ncbi:hypothetical protein [Paludibacterium yongneupense]|uniref:hypothetical protein n=1 Tax=Paludibacterium yongneupense TaxID=400061 RepID=UPI00049061E1|nr:hypothetical protein [Paludibacterium yongneupense]
MAISSVSNGTPIYKPAGSKPAQGQQPAQATPTPAPPIQMQVPPPSPTTNPEGQPVGQVINTSA